MNSFEAPNSGKMEPYYRIREDVFLKLNPKELRYLETFVGDLLLVAYEQPAVWDAKTPNRSFTVVESWRKIRENLRRLWKGYSCDSLIENARDLFLDQRYQFYLDYIVYYQHHANESDEFEFLEKNAPTTNDELMTMALDEFLVYPDFHSSIYFTNEETREAGADDSDWSDIQDERTHCQEPEHGVLTKEEEEAILDQYKKTEKASSELDFDCYEENEDDGDDDVYNWRTDKWFTSKEMQQKEQEAEQESEVDSFNWSDIQDQRDPSLVPGQGNGAKVVEEALSDLSKMTAKASTELEFEYNEGNEYYDFGDGEFFDWDTDTWFTVREQHQKKIEVRVLRTGAKSFPFPGRVHFSDWSDNEDESNHSQEPEQQNEAQKSDYEDTEEDDFGSIVVSAVEKAGSKLLDFGKDVWNSLKNILEEEDQAEPKSEEIKENPMVNKTVEKKSLFGIEYYVDESTKSVSLDNPLGWKAMPENWEAKITDNQEIYYCNRVTGKLVWRRPTDKKRKFNKVDNKINETTSSEDNAAKPIPLPPNWKQGISTTGKVYFYNTMSEVSQWAVPRK